ncbi:MAG: Eco57I restriction-modification methylase domain-containing protein, partial [Bacteroidales bacterium]
MKEDEPLETEVAIDPEMLGKVFERMLDVTERKSKGAFYTPREIVHYMAQQSLLYFLVSQASSLGISNEDDWKADLETFIHYGEHIIDKDIAVAEGKLKNTAKNQKIPDSIKQHANAIDKALEKIKICDPAVGSGAFPVGIMNEIVKLRKLLTPFMEKESADERSAYRFKSNAIQNSIYGVDIDAGAVEIAKLRLWLSMVVDEERIDTIEPLPNLDYKIVQGNSLINMPDGFLRNGNLEKQIEELIENYKTITDKEIKQKQKEIIDDKIKQLLAFASEFAGYDIDFDFKLFFHEVWKEKDGFDIVIGNPPYITYKGKQKVEVSQNLIDALILNYKNSAEYKINSFALFTELGTRIFNRIGVLTYIIPSTILQNKYLKKIRKLLLTKNNIVEIVTFENKVFKAVTDSLILFVNKELKENEITLFKRKKDLQFLKEDVVHKFKSSMWKIPPDYVINTKSNHEEDRIIKKIENQNKPLGDLLKVYVGIVAHGIKQFLSDKKQDENYKKYLQGRHLNNFTINPAKLFVNFDVSKLHSNINENVYLKKEKILVRKTGNKLIAAYDNSQYFTDQSIYNLYTDNKKNSISLKYICSLLN